MKKLLIIAITLVSLYSCKKDAQVQSLNISNTSWISGKWKRTVYVDTIYSSGLVYGINHFSVDLNPKELNFNTESAGINSIVSESTFTYSLSSNTLIYNTGNTWTITQINATSFKLTMHSTKYGIGYLEQYTKQ